MQQGVSGQQIGIHESRYNAFYEEERLWGGNTSDCQHFLFLCRLPGDSGPIYELSTATHSSLFGLGFVLGSSFFSSICSRRFDVNFGNPLTVV